MHKLVNYDDSTIPEFQKQFNVKDAIFMASLTWLDVKQQTLMRKLYPLIMFEAEDKSNSEGFGKKSVVSELRETDGSAKLSVTDEALEERVDVDKDEAITFTLTDEELINAVIEENHEKMTEADGEEDDLEPKDS